MPSTDEAMLEYSNIAQALPEMAARKPFQPAVIFPAGSSRGGQARFIQYTFRQLDQLCDRTAHALTDYGIHKGMRVLLLVRPGVDLIGVTFALFKMGAVPVIIDPGMGRRAFLRCVQDAQPGAFIGIPAAHLLRLLYPSAFRSVSHAVTVGRPAFWNAPALEALLPAHSQPFAAVPMPPDAETAVAFTSGGTGIPKGVVFRQEMFQALLGLLRDEIGIQPGEVDLPGLYIFALFGPALGVTEVFPDMDRQPKVKAHPAGARRLQTRGPRRDGAARFRRRAGRRSQAGILLCPGGGAGREIRGCGRRPEVQVPGLQRRRPRSPAERPEERLSGPDRRVCQPPGSQRGPGQVGCRLLPPGGLFYRPRLNLRNDFQDKL